MATTMLVINCIPATGAQMRLILPGGMVFNTVPMPENKKTNRITIFENAMTGIV